MGDEKLSKLLPSNANQPTTQELEERRRWTELGISFLNEWMNRRPMER